jgi:hypothetical protein
MAMRIKKIYYISDAQDLRSDLDPPYHHVPFLALMGVA